MAGVSDKVMAYRARTIAGYLTAGAASGPVTAKALATVCGIDGGYETQRRRIREAVKHGREKLGYRFCADADGYWLARNAAEWAKFREARVAKQRFGFVRDARCQRAVTERLDGQGMLFETRPPIVGVPDV